jgi:cytochrome P450
MTTATSPVQLENIAIDALATCPDPAAWHEALRSLGTHARAGQWIVSTPLDVAAALAAPTLRVVPPPTAAGPAADLIARMARFCDGEAHRRRRALTVQLLPTVREVAGHAADGATEYLRMQESAATLDVMPLARTLPARALARALGLSAPDATLAADLTGRLCEALASPRTPMGKPNAAADAAETADAPEADHAGAAASQLCAVLRGLPLSSEDEVAAAASILFQARDATAALIGAAVLAPAPGEPSQTAVRVESALRREAPVQCTRRAAAADTTIGAAFLPSGSAVWIFVAAAELGNRTPATFGSGPHGCPGGSAATAIAREVVTALDAGGWRPVAGQRVEYEPRPNLRLPRRVLVSRR